MFETDATVLVGFVGLIAVLLHYVGFSVQRFFDSCFSVIDAPLSIDDTAEVVPL